MTCTLLALRLTRLTGLLAMSVLTRSFRAQESGQRAYLGLPALRRRRCCQFVILLILHVKTCWRVTNHCPWILTSLLQLLPTT